MTADTPEEQLARVAQETGVAESQLRAAARSVWVRRLAEQAGWEACPRCGATQARNIAMASDQRTVMITCAKGHLTLLADRQLPRRERLGEQWRRS
jgi:hypothetical protein